MPLPVVSQTLPPILDGVGDDGGVVELARHEDQLLADLPPPHLLVEAGGVAVGQRVPRVLRVQLGILQDLSFRRRQSLIREKCDLKIDLKFWKMCKVLPGFEAVGFVQPDLTLQGSADLTRGGHL